MANEEHLAILKQGVEVWNTWREENPDIEVNLRGANLCEANLILADLSEADLSGANLHEAGLMLANLHGASLSGADFSGADFIETNLSEVDFSGTNLHEADLSGADLSGADLSGANLSGADFLGANLCEADLCEADLREANLSGANLSGAKLNGANLWGADLSHADLSGADLSEADLPGATFWEADLSGANLSGANLIQATLIQTNLEGATLTNCKIYGISAWDLKLDGATQTNLVITPHRPPEIRVDDIRVAQFIYLLLDHKELRNVLNVVTEKGVLILGRFGDGGLEVLQAIAQELRELKYLPMIFDFERPEGRNYTETVKTLAGLSRFIIADLSGPSVPQELYATIPHFKIPFVPILEKGRKKFAMFVDLFEYPWVLDPFEFENKEQLLKLLPEKVIAPAEERHQERQKMLDKLFK